MTERDLTRILTAYVQDVHLPEDARRNIRLAAKEEPKVKKKFNAAIVLVVVLVMLTTVGVAANLGMFDFLARHTGTQVLPGATSVTSVGLAETDLATFTISEAAFDGRGASVMVKVTPKDEKTFLIGEGGFGPDDPALCIIRDESLGEMTIWEYAKSHGYENIVVVNGMFINERDCMSVVDDWQDNELIWVYGFEASGDEVVLNFEGMTIPFDSEGNLDWTRDQRTATASFTMKASAPLWTARAKEAVEVPDCGVRIEEVNLTGTVLATYVEIRATITDEAAAELIGFRPTDAEGTELRPGSTLIGGHGSDKDGELYSIDCVVPMESAPDTLYLTVRNYRTNTDTLLTLPLDR